MSTLRPTDKDAVIDHIEQQCFGDDDSFTDDIVEVLHRVRTADLFLLQKAFLKVFTAGYDKGWEERST